MIRRLFLYLTDARLRAVLKTLDDCAEALDGLAKAPASAPGFFGPRLRGLALARAAGPAAPARSAALAAADDFTARLEKFFADLALHRTAPDTEMVQALACLQAACLRAPGLLSPRRRAAALAGIRALAASGSRVLRGARTAAEARPGNFPQNLKFSSIYSGLDAVFDAFERCASALYES